MSLNSQSFVTLSSILLSLQVETIGDAYMVVGGLPTRYNNHAERVCNQALDMIKYSQRVKNPINGKSINVGLLMCNAVLCITILFHIDTCRHSQRKCCGRGGWAQNAQVLFVRRYCECCQPY